MNKLPKNVKPKGGTSLDGPKADVKANVTKARETSLDRPVEKATAKTKEVAKPVVKAAKEAPKQVAKVTKNIINKVTGKKEEHLVLASVGGFGMSIFNAQRLPIAITNMVIGVLALCFYCVALAGCSSSDEETIRDGAWLVYTGGAGNSVTYLGVTASVTFDKNGKYVKKSIAEYADCNTDACDVCHENGSAAIAFLSLAFVLIFPIIGISFLRMAPENASMNKFIAVVCLCSSLIFIIVAMSIFAGCRDEVYDFYENWNKTGDDLEYGPGFVCLALNLLTCMVVFILHLFVQAV